VRARFPAGTHWKAHRLRGMPLRWPVSGLTEAARDAFPENVAAQRRGSSGLVSRAGGPRIGLPSAYRCGGSSG
jgi:hypothetical protein